MTPFTYIVHSLNQLGTFPVCVIMRLVAGTKQLGAPAENNHISKKQQSESKKQHVLGNRQSQQYQYVREHAIKHISQANQAVLLLCTRPSCVLPRVLFDVPLSFLSFNIIHLEHDDERCNNDPEPPNLPASPVVCCCDFDSSLPRTTNSRQLFFLVVY